MDYETSKKNILSSIIAGDKGFKLNEFVAEVQGFSLGLRLEHWETTSYELHKAVEMTQESIDGLIDSFVEAFIGMSDSGRPEFIKEIKAITDENYIIKCLKDLSVKDTSLLNIRDEMLQAVYKYKYLKTLK